MWGIPLLLLFNCWVHQIQNASIWCIQILKRYFSATKWDNTICVVFYSLNFLNVHLLKQRRRAARHTVWIFANGISLMICSVWSLSSSSVCGFVAYTVFFKVPQKKTYRGVKWGDRGLHQHSRNHWNFFLPHRSFNTSCTVPSNSSLSRFLVIVNPRWWCTKFNLPASWTSITFSTFQ